jgi:membrane-associated HD superfamily phosphohydrolase
MNYVAVVGYSCLFVFSTLKLKDTIKNKLDLLANLLLLTGLGTLIAYHVRLIQTNKSIDKDALQRKLRLVAHSSITTFFLITLLPYSFSHFSSYDVFGLAGHVSLFVAVLKNMSQLFGVGMLALYFVGSSMRAGSKQGIEMLQFTGRLLMTIFFIVTFINAFIPQ